MQDSFLEVSHLAKTYGGVKALDDFAFSIRRGEVHCLVGENGSGKSTFMKIVAGAIKPDKGCNASIIINGRLYHKLTPHDAIKEGIEVIYQDLSLFPNLSVAENIAISERIEKSKGIVSYSYLRRIAQNALDSVEVAIPLDELVEDLSIAKQQIVAICRALSSRAKLIIMDEPTASLGKKDAEHLFGIIRKLKVQGISIIFVGHKLDEVLEIADRITVIRDGKQIRTFESPKDTNERKIIELMTGRSISDTHYSNAIVEEIVFEVKNFGKKGEYDDISFSLAKGDILGIIGLIGAGRTELATSLFGLNQKDSGQLFIEGEKVEIHNAQEAIQHGIGYVPESRMTQGLFSEKTIRDNIVAATALKFRKSGILLDLKAMDRTASSWKENLQIKTDTIFKPVKQLSGGNQQRVVLSKWLESKPRILILDEPTVGIDVGAKAEIHGYIQNLAKEGMAVIMISDEIQEVLENANRILVMKQGKIIRELTTDDSSEDILRELLQ